MVYLLAVLAACANATASVLQRKANRELPELRSLSPRLIPRLARKPVWLLGLLAVIVGFLLQASALAVGELSVVEPILVCDLPLTLLLASWVFHARMRRLEWTSAVGISAGLAAVLFFLAPSGGSPQTVRVVDWLTAGAATLAVVGVAVVWGRVSQPGGRPGDGGRAAAAFGVAAGTDFGLTAALMKGAMSRYQEGFGAVFSAWQLYAMVATGLVGMFLLQAAMHAGRLLAAQPGLTLADPLASVAWGVLVFDERVRGGWSLLPALLGAVLLGGSVLVLARSPLLSEGEGPSGGGGPSGGAGPGHPAACR